MRTKYQHHQQEKKKEKEKRKEGNKRKRHNEEANKERESEEANKERDRGGEEERQERGKKRRTEEERRLSQWAVLPPPVIALINLSTCRLAHAAKRVHLSGVRGARAARKDGTSRRGVCSVAAELMKGYQPALGRFAFAVMLERRPGKLSDQVTTERTPPRCMTRDGREPLKKHPAATAAKFQAAEHVRLGYGAKCG